MFNKISFQPKLVLQSRGHVFWVLFQHALTKGLFAAKFLLAARLLGPTQFGLVGVALATLAIVESLSDTGINQALIQREKLVSKTEAGAVWTIQLARGAALLCILYLFSNPIASLFGIADAAPLIALAALLPLVRNAVNPGYAVLLRDRQFRSLAWSEVAISLVDFVATVAFVYRGLGPMSVLLGSLVADACRLGLSWVAFRLPMRVNVGWGAISDMGRYGRWIWGTSVITVALNQFDKIVVARWLGASQFGMYQTASRLAQMAVADVAVALGGFLFPTISNLHHQEPERAKAYFLSALKKIGAICGCLALVAIVVGPPALNLMLGPAWQSMGVIFQLQCVSMWFGALIAVCVAYLKATGRPRVISVATTVQLFVLVLPSFWVISWWGAVGMAGLVAASLGTSFLVMFVYARESH